MEIKTLGIVMKITQFTSSFNGALITFIDYEPKASVREKRRALEKIRELNAEEYIKEKRPRVYAELLASTK